LVRVRAGALPRDRPVREFGEQAVPSGRAISGYLYSLCYGMISRSPAGG
jgi:hypothetical protein